MNLFVWLNKNDATLKTLSIQPVLYNRQGLYYSKGPSIGDHYLISFF